VNINSDTGYHAYILIYTSRAKIKPKMRSINIHNQCTDFDLTSPWYFNSNIYLKKRLDQKIDASGTMNVDFKYPPKVFEGVITYKLERKSIETDNLSESTCIRLFVILKCERNNKLCACMHLVEHEKRFRWNIAKLKEYYQRYANQFSTYTGPIEETWLIDDNTVLMTKLELDLTQRDGALNIIISEGAKNERTMTLKCIDSER
jgi:hypothetical protein